VIWRALINAMLQMGLSPNQVNYCGATPADLMVYYYDSCCQQQATFDICSDLLNAGGYMTHRALDWRHHPNVFNPMYSMTRGDGRWNDTLWRDYSIPLLWSFRDKKELQGEHFSLKEA
jgi:MoaA/NifB/PqqE/SkfB family radical SAM enzyme